MLHICNFLVWITLKSKNHSKLWQSENLPKLLKPLAKIIISQKRSLFERVVIVQQKMYYYQIHSLVKFLKSSFAFNWYSHKVGFKKEDLLLFCQFLEKQKLPLPTLLSNFPHIGYKCSVCNSVLYLVSKQNASKSRPCS